MSSLTTRVLYDLVARDNASRTFLRVGESATGLEKKTAGLGAAISRGLAVGTLAAGAFGAASVKLATDFQTSMTKISTQAGGSAKDVKVLSDQVLKLGGKVQQAPKDLADSLYHLKSVGMDNVDAMKALREASDLAAVGGASLEETTNALAGAWRTGIKGATSFHMAVSTVNAIIGAGNMRMEDFNAAIGTGILASAKTFGLSLNQVGAALALMTDEGIPATDAATRLRMSFSLLGAPSAAAEVQLKKIGLTGLQLGQAMRGPDGLIGAIQLLKDHLDKSGLSAAQQSQILSRAFGGGRSSSGILTLINNLDVLKKKQDQVNKSAGRFDQAVEQQRKTAEAQWKRLVGGLESLSVRLGTKILPPVTGFIGFLNDKAMPAAAKFGRVMGDLVPVGKIQQGLSTAKGLVSDFFNGLTGGKGIGNAVGDFVTGLTGGKGTKRPAPVSKDLLPSVMLTRPQAPRLLARPQARVTPALRGPAVPRLLARRSLQTPPLFRPASTPGILARPKAIKPPKSQAQAFGETIRNAISGGISHLNWGKLGSGIGQGLVKAIETGAKLAVKLTAAFGSLMGKIDWVGVGISIGKFVPSMLAGLAVGLLNFDFGGLLKGLGKHWQDVLMAVVAVAFMPAKWIGGISKFLTKIPFVGKLLAWAFEGFAKFSKGILKYAGKALKFLGKAFLDGFRTVFPGIGEAFGRELELLPTRLGVWALELRAWGVKAIGKLGDGIVKGTEFVFSKLGEFTGKLLKPFAKAGSWLLGKGKDFVLGLTRGIADRAAGIGGWVWGKIKPAVDLFKNVGSWLWSKGKDFVAGLLRGVLERAKGIGSWAWDHIAKPQIDMFRNAASWLVTKGRQFVGGMVSGVLDRAKGIGNWVWTHVAKPQIDMFKNAGSWLHDKGGALITGMKNGIVDKIKGIGDWIKSNIIDPVVSGVKHFFGIRSPSTVFAGIGGHLITGLIKGMAKTSPTAIAKKVFGGLPKALAAIVKKGLVSISSLPGKAMKALGGLGGDILSFLGIGGGGGGGSVNRWAGAVATVLSMLGAPAYAQGAVLKRIEIESGGNPNAINLWDSNAKAGHPSQGLMQTIPSTFNTYAGPFRSRGITDPLASIYAGVNYAMHAYGGDWINVMTRPGGYAKGTGGAARGLAWVGENGPELVNFKGGEDVLSHPQSVAFAAVNGIRLPGYASGTISNAVDRIRRDRHNVEAAKEAVYQAKRRHKGLAAAEKRLKAAEKELQAAEVSLRNANRTAKASISNLLANNFVKTLSTGTVSSITSAIKSLTGKLLSGGFERSARYVMRAGGRLESLASKRTSIEQQIAAANQYASDQASTIRDSLSISGTSATSVRALISQMTGQQRGAASFVSEVSSLKARGASKELLQQLSAAGVGSQLATILGDRSVTTMDIARLNSLVKGGNKLATGFGQSMADMMYDSGRNAGKGFLAGLKGQEADLQKEMAKLAGGLVKAVKKALKIKSPSVVFRDEVGKNIALGMVVGMDRHRPHVAAAARRLASTAHGAARAGSARGDSAYAQLAQLLASGQLGGTEVHVHFDDPALRDLIKVTAKPLIKASEDRQAHRAKVGRR